MALRQDRFKSRKLLRKEARKAKKQRRHEYYANRSKRKVEKVSNENAKKTNPINLPAKKSENFKNLQEEQDYEIKQEKKQKKILDEEVRKKRIERLIEDNEEEEKEIKKLEKQLKFRKGKVSGAFTLDGLDSISDLLDLCEKKIGNNQINNRFQDSDSEFENDLVTITGKKDKKGFKDKNEKEITFDDDDDNNDNSFPSDESNLLSNVHFEDEIDNLPRTGKHEKEKCEKQEKVKEKVLDIESKNSSTDICIKKKKQEKHVTFSGSKKFCDELDENEGIGEVEYFFSDEGDESDECDKDPPKKKIKKEGYKKDISSANNSKKDKKNKSKKKKKKKIAGEKKIGEELDIFSEDNKFGDDISGNESNKINGKGKSEKLNESQIWEDIYGRTRDKEGNVVKAYKPPQLRNLIECENNKDQERSLRLKRQLKGLLNRLAENNMASISSQIEQLYMSHSRNEMNTILKELFTEAIVAEVLMPERLIAEHAMLVAILHANIGSEIGAYFLQFAVIHFDQMLKNENITPEDKSTNNLLTFIMQLYNFQVFHSKLMYDVIHEMLKNLHEKQIELLLLTLRTVGFSLRKDDPVALKSVVLKIQEQAHSLTNNDENYSRMKYMLEIVSAIKNNNVSKIPNYNPELIEHLKKCMKVLIRKGNYNTELSISLNDLLNAEEHGRWWVVGSAWSGSGPVENNPKSIECVEPSVIKVSFSQKLLDLARKQRMNTDVRRTIFCTLMSAEDYLDAFEKLMKLGLKGSVEREIINVLLHCSLQEKDFNPYYFHLANKFCTFDRKYQIMIQYAIWDKIKELNNFLPIQVTNLAKFLGNIILGKGLPLSVLKVIQFSELDKIGLKFARQVLLTIFLADEETVATVFARIVNSPKLKLFRDGIRLFLHHFLLKNIKSNPDEGSNHLTKMIEIADKVLTSSDLRMIF